MSEWPKTHTTLCMDLTIHNSYVKFHNSYVKFHNSYVKFHNSYVKYHNSYVKFHNSYVKFHNSYVKYHNSYVKFHNSYVMFHNSYVKFHNSHCKNELVILTLIWLQEFQCWINNKYFASEVQIVIVNFHSVENTSYLLTNSTTL